MKQQNIYKGLLPFQSEFSHKYACWANNHNGWSKMKKYNKKIANKKLRRQFKKEIYANNEDFLNLKSCKDCLFFNMCKLANENISTGQKVKDILHNCNCFKQ